MTLTGRILKVGSRDSESPPSREGGKYQQVINADIDAAEKLQQWKPFILNWHNHRISTGKLEATNRKIGTLQRNACGYRDEEYLKLRIYNIHTSTYALTG